VSKIDLLKNFQIKITNSRNITLCFKLNNLRQIKKRINSNCSKNHSSLIDGNWGEWSAWHCSVTCGNGTQTRKRFCDNPEKSGNGRYCSGDGSFSFENKHCNLTECGKGLSQNFNF